MTVAGMDTTQGTHPTIVVGLDASERATGVLNAAIEFARARGATLHIVRAVPLPVELPPEALSMDPNSLPTSLLTYADQALTKAIANVPAGLLARHEARIGTPWQVICDIATETNAVLVVIGTHGYHVLDRLLGTTAARVVNHAHCNVLVVRDPAGT